MSRTSDLMNLGMASELAEQVGPALGRGASYTCAGSAITDAVDIKTPVAYLGTASAAGAQLPDWPLWETVLVCNESGAEQSIYPHSGTGTIEGGSGGAAQAVANGKSALFIRRSATDWKYIAID